jgi:hypothetical protein
LYARHAISDGLVAVIRTCFLLSLRACGCVKQCDLLSVAVEGKSCPLDDLADVNLAPLRPARARHARIHVVEKNILRTGRRSVVPKLDGA